MKLFIMLGLILTLSAQEAFTNLENPLNLQTGFYSNINNVGLDYTSFVSKEIDQKKLNLVNLKGFYNLENWLFFNLNIKNITNDTNNTDKNYQSSIDYRPLENFQLGIGYTNISNLKSLNFIEKNKTIFNANLNYITNKDKIKDQNALNLAYIFDNHFSLDENNFSLNLNYNKVKTNFRDNRFDVSEHEYLKISSAIRLSNFFFSAKHYNTRPSNDFESIFSLNQSSEYAVEGFNNKNEDPIYIKNSFLIGNLNYSKIQLNMSLDNILLGLEFVSLNALSNQVATSINFFNLTDKSPLQHLLLSKGIYKLSKGDYFIKSSLRKELRFEQQSIFYLVNSINFGITEQFYYSIDIDLFHTKNANVNSNISTKFKLGLAYNSEVNYESHLKSLDLNTNILSENCLNAKINYTNGGELLTDAQIINSQLLYGLTDNISIEGNYSNQISKDVYNPSEIQELAIKAHFFINENIIGTFFYSFKDYKLTNTSFSNFYKNINPRIVPGSIAFETQANNQFTLFPSKTILNLSVNYLF